MRAVSSTLAAAGGLKKQFPDQSEEIIILKAINQINQAKFFANDLPLFNQITKDLFPKVKLAEENDQNQRDQILTLCN